MTAQRRGDLLDALRSLASLTDDAAARTLLRAEATAEERATGQPAADLEVSTPRVDPPRVVARVDDPAAFLAHVKAITPVEVETVERVRSGFEAALLDAARLDPGTRAPGISVFTYPARVVLRLSGAAGAIGRAGR